MRGPARSLPPHRAPVWVASPEAVLLVRSPQLLVRGEKRSTWPAACCPQLEWSCRIASGRAAQVISLLPSRSVVPNKRDVSGWATARRAKDQRRFGRVGACFPVVPALLPLALGPRVFGPSSPRSSSLRLGCAGTSRPVETDLRKIHPSLGWYPPYRAVIATSCRGMNHLTPTNEGATPCSRHPCAACPATASRRSSPSSPC